MLARDAMTRTIVTIGPHMPVDAAAALLVTHGHRSAPVVTAEGELRGMVSSGDLARARLWLDTLPNERDFAITAGDAMTPEPATKRPGDDLADVAAVLVARDIRAVPIVDGGRLVGIVSRHDVLRCLAGSEAASAQAPRTLATAGSR